MDIVTPRNVPVKARSTFGSVHPPKKLPKGWSFLADSNEMSSNHLGYDLGGQVRKIYAGDYSIVDPDGNPMDRIVAVERKSLQNLIADVCGGRERQEKANERLAELPYPAIVIEADHSTVARDYPARWFNQAHRKDRRRPAPNAVLGTLIAWATDNRIPAWCCSSRDEGERMTRWILARVAHRISKGEIEAGDHLS